MEIEILNLIQNIRTPLLDEIMVFITKMGDLSFVWILMSALLIFYPKTRKTGIVVLVSLLVNFLLCNIILKNLVQRIRPFDVNTTIGIIIPKPTDFSFPSGHTSAGFTVAAALFCEHKKTIRIAALILAAVIAFSRLYLYVHYPTDVIGGIVIGIFSGYCGSKMINYYRKI